jgi:coenzyme F420-dependent glucose-6-phosphate dehydrogenase
VVALGTDHRAPTDAGRARRAHAEPVGLNALRSPREQGDGRRWWRGKCYGTQYGQTRSRVSQQEASRTVSHRLSAVERGTRLSDLVKYAQIAEQHEISFANISDHFHPWTDTQGQSPFVWAVIGGLKLGTWVTCPIMRMHPVIVAHAAATAAAMMEGRFFPGVGTGENLNEHISAPAGRRPTCGRHGSRRPSPSSNYSGKAVTRVITDGTTRSRTPGSTRCRRKRRLCSSPSVVPRVRSWPGEWLTASSPRVGGRPHRMFDKAGGRGRFRYRSLTVCWAKDEKPARRTAHRVWPNAPMESSLSWELPVPKYFDDVAKLVTEDAVAEGIVCGPDPERHVGAITEVRGGRLRPRRRPPGWPGPGGVFRFYAPKSRLG